MSVEFNKQKLYSLGYVFCQLEVQWCEERMRFSCTKRLTFAVAYLQNYSKWFNLVKTKVS